MVNTLVRSVLLLPYNFIYGDCRSLLFLQSRVEKCWQNWVLRLQLVILFPSLQSGTFDFSDKIVESLA